MPALEGKGSFCKVTSHMWLYIANIMNGKSNIMIYIVLFALCDTAVTGKFG